MARHRRRPSLILEHLEGRVLLDGAPGPSPIPAATPGQFRRAVQPRQDDRDGPARQPVAPAVVAPRAERPALTMPAAPAELVAPPSVVPPARAAAVATMPTLFAPIRVAAAVARAVPTVIARAEAVPLAAFVVVMPSTALPADETPAATKSVPVPTPDDTAVGLIEELPRLGLAAMERVIDAVFCAPPSAGGWEATLHRLGVAAWLTATALALLAVREDRRAARKTTTLTGEEYAK